MASLEQIIGLEEPMHVVDIGAAAIGQRPPYQSLLDKGAARLTAIDGDERHGNVIQKVIGDGKRHTLHLTRASNGMTSLLKPDPEKLAFFNGFNVYGTVEEAVEVQTERLGDVPELQEIDFLKMDVQGAELMILENAGSALDRCVAIHTEASFIPLYEEQPTFADIDRWMRNNGFLPHCFTDVKTWVIAPTVKNGDIRNPFNQLLECDVVYVRDLISLESLDEDQLRKLALIAADCYQSPDLCLHAIGELERRGYEGLSEQILKLFSSP